MAWDGKPDPLRPMAGVEVHLEKGYFAFHNNELVSALRQQAIILMSDECHMCMLLLMVIHRGYARLESATMAGNQVPEVSSPGAGAPRFGPAGLMQAVHVHILP